MSTGVPGTISNRDPFLGVRTSGTGAAKSAKPPPSVRLDKYQNYLAGSFTIDLTGPQNSPLFPGRKIVVRLIKAITLTLPEPGIRTVHSMSLKCPKEDGTTHLRVTNAVGLSLFEQTFRHIYLKNPETLTARHVTLRFDGVNFSVSKSFESTLQPRSQ